MSHKLTPLEKYVQELDWKLYEELVHTKKFLNEKEYNFVLKQEPKEKENFEPLWISEETKVYCNMNLR